MITTRKFGINYHGNCNYIFVANLLSYIVVILMLFYLSKIIFMRVYTIRDIENYRLGVSLLQISGLYKT